MKNKEILGIFLTIIWISIFIFLGYKNINFSQQINLSDISNYIAGIAGGLALLWVILGYFQQGEELESNTKALISQKELMNQQINENNRIQISDSYQRLTSTYTEFIMNIASKERLSMIWEVGKNNLEELSDIDIESFYLLCVVYMGHHENLFILKKYRALPDELYIGWNNNLRANLSSKGFQEYWNFEGNHYYPAFKKHVDFLINENKDNYRYNLKEYISRDKRKKD